MSSPLGQDGHSWVVSSEGSISTGGQAEYELPESAKVQEGDVIVSLIIISSIHSFSMMD